MHQLAIDTIHDEIVVPNGLAEAILFFRTEANGEEAPIRIIQGPKTKIGYTDNVAVDPIHNEVFTAQSRKNAILVFKRDIGGDVAPIRIIHGPKTKLSSPWAVAVDPKNDLLVAANQSEPKGILVFKRTDEGDVAPQAFISGPKTGMKPGKIREAVPRTVDVYPEGKKIIVPVTGSYDRSSPSPGFVGIWKNTDNGDVAPWAILHNPPDHPLLRGGALNPEAKEIMFVDIEKGALVVYHIPELFE